MRIVRLIVLVLVLLIATISICAIFIPVPERICPPVVPHSHRDFICPPDVLRRRRVMPGNQTLVFEQLGGQSTFGSQFWEDWFLYTEFFHEKKYWGSEHTFIELGAYDGTTGSNSLFYDRHLGWRGLLLEASTSNYALLEKSRLSFRVTTIHGAVCHGEPRMLTLWGGQSMTANNRKEANGLFHGTDESISVCQSMTAYLEMVGKLANRSIARIDYFSMDVEGQELDIIQSHDWKRYPVFVVSIEVAIQPLLSGTMEYQHAKRCALHQRGLCRWPFYDSFTPPVSIDSETRATFHHNNEIWINPIMLPRH